MEDRITAYRLLIADAYELVGISRSTSEDIANEFGQTAARWHVMSVISEDNLNVPAIARRLGLTRQSVQRVVDDLARIDLVSLEPNPDHQRSPLVALTDDGRHLMDRMYQRSEASRTALLDRAGVTVDELAAARRIVRSLLAAFAADDPAHR